MKTIKVVALMLALALLLGGCSLMRLDEERVSNQVVAKVNGNEIYKYEISEDDIQYYVQSMASYYAQMGLTYTQEDIDQMMIDERETMLEERVKAEVLLQKAQELGITLTEEEKADNMKEAQDYLVNIKDLFINQVEQEFAEAAQSTEAPADDASDDTSDEDAADADEPEQTEKPTDPAVLAEAETRYQQYVEESDLTVDSMYDKLCKQSILEKIKEYALGFAEVTDEEVRAWYDGTLENQQKEMDAAPGVFEKKISGSNIYTYVPQRIVAVRDILLAFDDSLAEDLKAAYDEGNTNQYDALMNAALSQYSADISTAANIKSRIDGGEEAEAIVEELSDQMENIFDNTPIYGYVIDPRTTDYSQNYVKAATELVTVGEVSEPFADYDGIHVLQLMVVYEPGIIPFEDLKDSIKTALLPGKQEDVYNEMVEQWMEEADIVYYYKRLNAHNDI